MSELDQDRSHDVGSAKPSSPSQSTKSNTSGARDGNTSERTPLLQRDQDTDQYRGRSHDRDRDDEQAEDASGSRANTHSAASLLRSLRGHAKHARRWPSLVALALLCVVAILIIALGFVTPSVVQEYSKQAMTVTPTSVSLDSFTSTGVRARIQADLVMDASKVKRKPVRDLGRFSTWVAHEVESGQSQVEVSLSGYGNAVLGTATIPPMKLDIRNGHVNHADFLADLEPGDLDSLRHIASDLIRGKLRQLNLVGQATVPLKCGLINLGRQTISHLVNVAGDKLPVMPEYKIHQLVFHDVELPALGRVVGADVSIEVQNPYPLDFSVPPLGFAISVDGCGPASSTIQVADATTGQLHVQPNTNIKLDVTAFVRRLPDAFTQACPGTQESPLDALLGGYMNGNETTIYVRGSDSPSLDTPRWITQLMSDITVPVPFPGHSFGNLIRNFSLADVHFGLPDPLAEPDTPEGQPSMSAQVKALVALPEEMNINLSVDRIRANADVYYHGSKLGFLDLRKWQPANSTRAESAGEDGPSMLVESSIVNAPLQITDEDVFTEVIQALLVSGKSIMLGIVADVDVEIKTALGNLAVRKIPAKGIVPIKPIGHGHLSSFTPKVGNLQILDTGKTSLTLQALVNFTNPTPYSATIPYADIHILANGTLLGHATARSIAVKSGENTNIPVTAIWDPVSMGGEAARKIGLELLSQYISGYNTTLTLRTHNGSIPSQPALGHALQKFQVDMPTPSLGSDPSGGDGGMHFIQDATMHLITSTATFTMLSPLKSSTLYVTYINATAFYHDDEVGHIDYERPFAVPPGMTTSPRLPVTWNIGSVGYDAVRGALGGSLQLAARATVGIRLGKWEERIWYQGAGIGAKVRL